MTDGGLPPVDDSLQDEEISRVDLHGYPHLYQIL